MDLYEILKNIFGSNVEIGRHFPRKGRARTGQAVGKWKKQGVPEDVAILCHLDPAIPYQHPPLTNGSNGVSNLSGGLYVPELRSDRDAI